MSDTVIRVENLGKKYIIKHQQQGRSNYVALRDVMANGVKTLGRRVLKPGEKREVNPAVEEFWALKDVSFEIKRGDRVGIIGRNGAGKSTLLKVLSRITEPTTGRISLRGRVASLLEVGTGFHPELTGRENIFLNGAILGMSKVEIKKKFDEIVAFAEVEKFLDTPVKRYSSGMYVRLAFAVAAHLEPEILVVDEVLAVGDAQFQKKCLGKMEDVARNEGRTVLFVSHNAGAIKKLCNRAILLSKGSIIGSGYPADVIKQYLEGDRENIVNLSTWKNKSTVQGCPEVELLSISLLDSTSNFRNSFSTEEDIAISVEYTARKSLKGLRVVVQLQTVEGIVAFTSCEDSSVVKGVAVSPGIYEAKCYIPANLLNVNVYRILIALDIPKHKVIMPLTPTIQLSTTSGSRYYNYSQSPPGVVFPELNWSLRKIS